MNGYNFTNDVRSSLLAAREEAAALNHEYVGTEHILLGLLRVDRGIPIAVCRALNVAPHDVRRGLLEIVQPGTPGARIGPDLPYTARAKKVLEEAMNEARELSNAHVGTEHLLLGLLRERRGLAANALVAQGLTLDAVRREIVRILRDPATAVPTGEQSPSEPVASSFLIIIQDSRGGQGTRRFTNVADAIDYLKDWRQGPS